MRNQILVEIMATTWWKIKASCSVFSFSTSPGLSIDTAQWDLCHLPLRTSSVDIITTDMPFGKRYSWTTYSMSCNNSITKQTGLFNQTGLFKMNSLILFRKYKCEHVLHQATPESTDSRLIKQEWPQMDLNGKLHPHLSFTDLSSTVFYGSLYYCWTAAETTYTQAIKICGLSVMCKCVIL